LPWPAERIAELCRKWKVEELAVFGSALRGGFGPGSDLDLLVRFAPDAEWTLLDHSRMERELEALLGRKVDLVTRAAIEESPNWVVRNEILRSARTAYVR
jgi:predicted nucleotidyltransferase